MLTFCTGSTTFKRRYFRSMSGEGVASVDNDEIIATFSLDKKLYAVAGEIPYATMSVEQFIACSRALMTRLPINKRAIMDMLARVGLRLPLKRRLSRISRVQYRALSLVTKLDESTKTIFVNFDGLEYNRKNKKSLLRFLMLWAKNYDVYAAVSDTRFIPLRAISLNYSADGIKADRVRIKSKAVKKSVFRKKLKKGGMDVALPSIKKVVTVAS